MKREVIGVTTAAVLALSLSALRAQDAPGAVPRATGDGKALLPKCNPATSTDCETPPPTPSGQKCSSVSANPPSSPQVRYTCGFTVTDAYGQPAAGVPVQMESFWCNKNGSRVRATTTGVTGADGREALTLFSRPSNVVECRISDAAEPLFGGPRTAVKKQAAALPTLTRVDLMSKVQPAPRTTVALTGLEAGEGRMDLFQSGAYDKVLLVAEQFDPLEHNFAQRDRRRFWRQLSPLLTELFKQGWDVWLVQPHDTGDSLHEQAAEFAQAVAKAREGLPVFPNCFSPTVGLLGFNTGGLVARIAAARWEADPAWRAQLALPAALPVKFLATFDAPHYGLHLNLDMQESVWKSQTATEITTRTNLDSCAASQFLRGRYDLGTGRRTNEDFLNFFVNGAPTHFFSKKDNTEHECAAGPAVATLNAARGVPGWPSGVVRIGFTQSHPADATKCFTNPALNRNANGEDLCKFVGELAPTDHVFVPVPGQTWLRFFADDPTLPDLCPDEFWNVEDKVEWSDVAPGSRSPFFLDGFVTVVAKAGLFCEVFAHQRFPSTLVPFVSAAGIQGPRGGSPYEAVPSPFNELFPSGASRVADVVELSDGAQLLARLNAFAPGCTPPVVSPN